MNIPINTVFNPTVNGPLHLGHIYMMKVNEWEAGSAGGRFIVRFDDTQAYWMDRIGWKAIEAFKDDMKRDAEWMGIEVDQYASQSSMKQEAAGRLVARCREAGIPVPEDHYGDCYFPETTWSRVQPYPYTAFKTAEKCIFDDMLDITLKIRGEDLYGEFSLYCYFRETFRMFQPRQVFIPRLILSGTDSGAVSKSAAVLQVKQLREAGWEAEDLMDHLRTSCLINPLGHWSLDNLKIAPVYRGGSHE